MIIAANSQQQYGVAVFILYFRNVSSGIVHSMYYLFLFTFTIYQFDVFDIMFIYLKRMFYDKQISEKYSLRRALMKCVSHNKITPNRYPHTRTHARGI